MFFYNKNAKIKLEILRKQFNFDLALLKGVKMKSKIIILFSILLIVIFVQTRVVEAEGIIIADDQKILNIFRDYKPNQIIALAQKLDKYDKVILHLGAQKVFSRGHPFFYKTSKKNWLYN